MKLKGGSGKFMNIDNDLRTELLNFSVDSANYQNCFQLYVYLLMYAKFESGEINGIELKRGQCLTSIATLAEKTKMSERNIRTAIDKLIKYGYIKKYATKKYTIITLCHYDKHKQESKNKQQNVSNNKDVETNTKTPQKQTDAERYRYLSEEILKRDLTAEEKEFFNNYNGG